MNEIGEHLTLAWVITCDICWKITAIATPDDSDKAAELLTRQGWQSKTSTDGEKFAVCGTCVLP